MSKTNDTVFARLAEVNIAEHERIRAEAHLMRAEVLADLMATAINAVKRLFKTARPAALRRSVSAG